MCPAVHTNIQSSPESRSTPIAIMSQKDSLSKLKNFFRMDKNSSGSSREKTDADLLHEIEVHIQPQITATQRCKMLKELSESDKISRLEDNTIIRLWELTKDLITSSRPWEQRHITYRFYQKLLKCQFEDLSLTRVHFFRVIQGNDNEEDVQCQLDLLKTLTDNGKNIKDIDDVIGDFILNRWLAKLQDTKQIREILIIVHNIIVYNAAYLDPDIVNGIITYACLMCCTPDDIVLQCLDVLDAILCYTVLPNKMLPEWVNALCRTVNREIYVQKSWDIMKKLLGTKMGHAALLYMCNLLNNSNYVNDDALLRGAVFYINMGLWGSTCSNANDLFKQSPTSVLQSFLFALKSQRVFVTYEVIIGIQRLIYVSGSTLSEPTWDVLCDILRTIADNIRYYENDGLPKDSVIHSAYHEALDKIEQLLQRKEAATDLETIYSVIEYVCESRSEDSIVHLMEYKATKITPTQTQWLQELNSFMNRFFNMQNFKIRDKSLQVLERIMDNNKSAYEEEILESIVIPTFSNIMHENDAKIRTCVGELLLKFVAQCDTKRSIELLDIVEKILNRPFDRFNDDNRIILKNDDELTHLTTIIDELIRVFLSKLHTLSTAHAIKIFSMLNTHLEKYYQKPMLLETSAPVRSSIFAWLLRIRANANYFVGYLDDLKSNRLRYSHFLSIDVNESNYHQTNRQQQNQPPALTQQSSQDTEAQAQTTISIKRSCKTFIDCLVGESDWSVMQLVLKGLPLILQNKALFRGVDMEALATAIIGMVTKSQHSNNKPRIESFIPATHKPQLSDFQALVINTIAALIPYYQNLNSQIQNRMITCLRPGLLSLETNTPRVCIQAFTVMLMEILELMLRHLAEILFDMSRMSTTLNVAVPVLEFLSTLSRLPSRLFANFTNTQYMYVFAISLPYTNPHKYDHYTVSLAHHVIAGWFLKCKLSWRKDFVQYILKGLTTNVQKPFEEMKRNDHAPINEDSSNRKRSSSLTERGAKQRERPAIQNLHIKSDEAADEVAYNFHMELADTCIDFLSRHTYSTCSALPKRSSTAEYLLTNGHSMSWLVGHNVVTITTSGCSSTAGPNGLCDRCGFVCKTAKLTEQNSSNGATSPEVSSLKSSGSEICRRYTKATLQHNSGEFSESSEFSNSSMTTPFGINAESGKFFKSSSNEGRFNSSGSLDALSRRGSNPDTLNHSSETVSKLGSIGSHPMYLSPQQSIERIKQVCICACSGWAEIVIRRPTGNMSWIMKIQNHIALDSLSCDVPLQDLINMCTPSLGEIYNIPDFMNQEQLWSSNVNIANEQMPSNETTKRKLLTVEPSSTKTTDVSEKKQETVQSTANITQKTENVTTTSAVSTMEANASVSHPLSGPINIPKSANAEKISSGSFSDVEPDDDDDGSGVAFDENGTKSRNPVRRVNSSPEMSSNWRHPFIGQKPNQPQSTGNNFSTHGIGDDDFGIMDNEQQQKKKNLRPSCEAIPEEIGDATPPKSSQIDQQKPIKADCTVSVIASGIAKNQHKDFIAKSTSAQSSSSSSSSSVSSSTTKSGQNSCVDNLIPSNPNAAPRKQHSADDAEQSQSRQKQPPMNEPRHSSSGSSINLGGSSTKFKLNIDMPNLASKPPQSHAPLSPRLLARNNLEMSHLNSSNNFNDFQRGRSKTISVVRGERDVNRDNSKWTFKGTRSVLSPNSIFLQFFYTGPNRVTEQPLLISQTNCKAIDMINYIPPFETHKIGVLYIGRDQAHNEIEILSNRYGSLRYMDFIQNLGALVSLKNAKELNLFIDMETDGRDGNFTYVWQDDIIQVTFHVATLMPNKEDDPNRTEKKKNIGNDYVSIVYNESGEDYNLSTIKGQFNYACVVIEPLELNSNRIFVRCKDDVAKFICHTEPKIISDAIAPGYARQLALHANLASLVAKSLQTKNGRPYASNWLERLRRIKHLRAKILKENGTTSSASTQTVHSGAKNERETEDFTQYT